MADNYELPGGLNWVKQHIHTIIGNKPLEEIMAFGDTWRARAHPTGACDQPGHGWREDVG